MSSELVSLVLDDGVAQVRLNRADKHNAMSLEMFVAIGELLERLAREPAVRVVVLAGAGESFCAGLDLALLRAMLGGGPAAQEVLASLMERGAGPANRAQQVAYGWKALPVPVIAAINGVAFGAGFQIALGCDLRIAAPTAKFSIMECRYGLIPDMSITQTLPELVPRDVALELSLSARVFDATEAHALGLVTRLEGDPIAAATALARTIAARSPDAVRALKRLYNAAHRRAPRPGPGRGLADPADRSPNQVEAVRASLEQREPRFRDPTA